MSFYNNIVEWNDSAGKEAFQNAKRRFWAEINGLYCDISLPDPDIYIDNIDWNSDIDPELLLDLDREPPVEEDGKSGSLGSGLYAALLNQPVICTGWGDADDPVPPVNDSAIPEQEGQWDRNAKNSNTCESGWGDLHTNGDNTNAWDNSAYKENSYNRNAWGRSKGASQVEENNSWGHWEHKVKEAEHMESRNDGRDWRSKASNHRKQGGGHYTYRYQGNHWQMNGGWKNGKGGKRANFGYEQPVINERPSAPRQWNSVRSCGPVNYDESALLSNRWSWEKPVS